MLLLILVGVVVLYLRTIRYNYVIDDSVKRSGYYVEAPLGAPPEKLYSSRPSVSYRLFMIGMHCVNTTVIYLLWGWVPAAIFAFHPIGAWGTAWVTGNYYATTLYFMLIGYYILSVFNNVFGFLAASALYVAALNSTVSALAFPFFLIATGNLWGFPMLYPLFKFFTGRRFQTGYNLRSSFTREHRVKAPFTPRRLVLMVKVMARYIYTVLFPDKMYFFSPFGENVHDNQKCYDDMHRMNQEFWTSLLVCLVVLTAGMMIHPLGTLWFFLFTGVHTQYKIMGQFFAIRYMYTAMVGMCIVVGTAIQSFPILLTVVLTYLILRTHFYIPAWSSMENICRNDLGQFPLSANAWNNLASHYMREGITETSPSWKINRLAYLIQRSYDLNPNIWEINMNVACFFAIVGQWPMCLKYTDRAIALLEPVADKPTGPLETLYKQRERIIKQAEEAVKQPEGATLSPSNCSAEQKVGRENGTRQGIEDTVEYFGSGISSGGET